MPKDDDGLVSWRLIGSNVVLQGLICYNPLDLGNCFLRKMDKSDYDNVRSLLESTQTVTVWIRATTIQNRVAAAL